MTVKCLTVERNIVSPARARTRTTRSGDERTNHEATTPFTTYLVNKGNETTKKNKCLVNTYCTLDSRNLALTLSPDILQASPGM